MRTKKKFDAVAEKERWEAEVLKATEGMSRDQRLAYFRRFSDKYAKKFPTVRTAGTVTAAGSSTVAEPHAMSWGPTIKGFDCLKMKEECQARVRKETEGMSQAELIAYYHRAAEKFDKRVRKAKRPGTSARRR